MIKRYLTEQIVPILKKKLFWSAAQDKWGKQLFILKTPKGKPVEYFHFFLCRYFG
jgi:hypothetical protein